MTIIGLTGMAGCGKDTVADILVRNLGYKRLAFADPLRAMAYDLDPIVGRRSQLGAYEDVRLRELVDRDGWDIAKRFNPEVRRTLQRIGTDVVRNHVGTTFWVDKALATMAESEPNVHWVITDCRFNNEAEAIDRVGWVVRITRPGLEPIEGGHVSESGVDDEFVSYELRNDSTIASLTEKVVAMAKYIERS